MEHTRDHAGPALRVIAVLVARDGAAFLPRTLAAVVGQSRRPDQLIAVDAGSVDGSAELLARSGAALLRLNRDTSFGDAVQAALLALDAGGLIPAAHPRPAQPDRAVPGVPAPRGVAETFAGQQVPLANEPAELVAPDGATSVVDWLWLLHDDSAPAPDVLERLLDAVDGGPSIGIAGCKQVSWDDDRRLLDVGFTTSRFGALVTGIDVDDLDQGQLDHRCDVLAVRTAGMLLRRTVWDALGGPDPALGQAREDLDLCRRAHLAGLRVVVVPEAILARAGSAAVSGVPGEAQQRRDGGVAGPAADRRAAIHLRLAGAALPLLPVMLIWLACAAVLRALARLALKQPRRAAAELGAFGLAVSRPVAWLRAGRRQRAQRRVPGRSFRRLLAGPRQAVRQRRDAFSSHLRSLEPAWSDWADSAGAGAGSADADGAGDGSAGDGSAGDVLSEPVAGEPDVAGDVTAAANGAGSLQRTAPAPAPIPIAVDVTPRRRPRPWPAQGEPRAADAADSPGAFDDERAAPRRRPDRRIAVLVAVVTGIAGLSGLRLLLSGSGVPLGPALIPAPATAAELWQLAMSGWRPSGLGVAATADPFDAVLAVIAWPLGGSPRAAAQFLLLAALPLAALLTWWAAGSLTRSRALRAWAALGWAASPALLAAVAAGRLDAIVAHLALPAAAVALARTVGRGGSGAARRGRPGRGRRLALGAASWGGLLFTVLIAAAPSLALPLLVVLLVAAASGRIGRGLLCWIGAVPAVLLLPWWIAVARRPVLLLAEPGGASGIRPGTSGWPLALWAADPAGTAHGPLPGLAATLTRLTSLGDQALWLRGFAIAVAVPLLGLGLSAVLLRRRRRTVAALWTAGLAGLLVAVLTPLLNQDGAVPGPHHGWPGPGVSLLSLALLGAALVRLDGAALRLRARNVGFRHVVTVGAGTFAVLAPLLVLGGWAVDGWSARPADWVHRGSPDVVPAVAAAEAEGPAATRTLVLKLSAHTVRWSLYRAGGPRIGQDSAASLASTASSSALRPVSTTTSPAISTATTSPAGGTDAGGTDAGDPVVALVAGLLSDGGSDQRRRFADLGIGSVLMLGPLDADADLALDTSPGLQRIATPQHGVLWTVQLDGLAGAPTTPARVRVLSSSGVLLSTLPSRATQVRARLDAGRRGRILVLAERADPGWQARLDGTALVPKTHDGWAQAFELPPEGGVVTVRYVTPGERMIDTARLLVVVLALLLATPLPRRRFRLFPPPSSFTDPPPGGLVPRPRRGPRAGVLDLPPMAPPDLSARADRTTWVAPLDPPGSPPTPGQGLPGGPSIGQPEPGQPEPDQPEPGQPEPVTTSMRVLSPLEPPIWDVDPGPVLVIDDEQLSSTVNRELDDRVDAETRPAGEGTT